MASQDKLIDFELQKYRDQIDEFDEEILSLLLKRQKQVQLIAEWKAKNNIPVKDKKREAEKLNFLCLNIPEADKKPIKKIFQDIMDFSKLEQLRPAKSDLQVSVGIVGIGLMGGSLYKAIKNYHPKIDLRAIDKRKDLDCPQVNMESILSLDYIFLCMPPTQIKKFIKLYGHRISNKSVVIDFASTKKDIVDFVQSHEGCKFRFVPAHPIVGKETSGFENCEVDLYINKKIIICSEEASLSADLKLLLCGVGLKLEYMTATQHDESFAFMSHLPHLLALALVLSSEKYISCGTIPQSFKDLTRISGASYELWSDIFRTNKKQIDIATEQFQKTLSQLINSVENLQLYFEKVKRVKEEYLYDHSFEEIPYRKPAA